MVTEYQQGGLNLGCDDALPDRCPSTTPFPSTARDDGPPDGRCPSTAVPKATAAAETSNGPRRPPLPRMEIEEPSVLARNSRISDDLGILDTSDGWRCARCCDLVQRSGGGDGGRGGENGARKTGAASRLARSVWSPLRHGNRRMIAVGGLVAIAVVMVIVAITIYCCQGSKDSEIPVTGLNYTVVGRGRVVQDVLPSHNQTSSNCDQQTLQSLLVRSLVYELRRLVEKTRFREQCTGFQVVGMNLEDGVFEYKVLCTGITSDHFTHDLRADMVGLLGATHTADLGIFVLDLASLQLQYPYHDELRRPEDPAYTPVMIPVCLSVPYNRTCYPNILHHQSHLEALAAGLHSVFLLEEPCSDHLYLLWCSVFVPDCSNDVPLPPCRSLCHAVLTDCPQLRPDFEQLLDTGCSRLPDDALTPCTGLPQEAVSSPKCHDVAVEECRQLGFTLTPGSGNLLGQSSGASLYWWRQLETIARRTQCSPHLMTFACSVFYPPCTEAEVVDDRPEVVGPCNSLCLAVKDDCGFFFSLAGMHFLADYNCSNHPSPTDRQTCPGTIDFNSTDVECTEDQFECDSRQCISSRWICDGRTDCDNGNDERHCAECPATDGSQFRCNNGQCIHLEKRCNGHVDCLQAEDEVNCLRVSTEEDGVEGLIEIYNPYTKDWDPVCIAGPLDDAMAKDLCNLNRLAFLTNNNRNVNDGTILGFLSTRTNCTEHQQSFVRCNYSDCTEGPLPGQVSRLLELSRFDRTLVDGDWPWIVSLHGGHRQSFYCGGILVTDQWILTAAHCIGSQSHRLDGLTVMAGHSRRTASDRWRQVRSALRLVVHPDFSAYLLNDDIALVLVDRPFRLGRRVRSLCLPDAAYQPTSGQMCYVGGWGKTSDTDRDYAEELRLRQLTVETVAWCNREPSAPQSFDGSKVICTTGRHGSDICQGDSGSAVLCESSPDEKGGYRRLILAGVVSSGFDGGHSNMTKILSVQTAIAPYTDWIRQEIAATSS